MVTATYTPEERRTKKRGFVVAQTTLPLSYVTHEQDHTHTHAQLGSYEPLFGQ